MIAPVEPDAHPLINLTELTATLVRATGRTPAEVIKPTRPASTTSDSQCPEGAETKALALLRARMHDPLPDEERGANGRDHSRVLRLLRPRVARRRRARRDRRPGAHP